jgi:CysZ protein
MAGGSVLLGLVSFTALTSVVGSPFYQHIAERIEDDLGVAEGRGRGPAWKPPLAEIRDAIVLTLRSLLFTIPLFLAGFLPAVGQTVVPVLVVLVTAWFMTLQVASVSFYRRGVYLRRQTAMLRQRRMLALGFGVPAVVLCMIPLMAIVVMPVTFAGGVLVALDVLA